MSDVETPDKTETKFDSQAFAMNIARAMESSGQALAAYLKPRETGEVKDKPPNEIAEVIKTFSSVAEYWMSDKGRAAGPAKQMPNPPSNPRRATSASRIRNGSRTSSSTS